MFGSKVLTWGQTLKLTVLGQQIHIWTLLDEKNTMAFLVFRYLLDIKLKEINIFLRDGHFLFKGIIRPFELKEIYLFYHLIDAGKFSYSNDMH